MFAGDGAQCQAKKPSMCTGRISVLAVMKVCSCNLPCTLCLASARPVGSSGAPSMETVAELGPISV